MPYLLAPNAPAMCAPGRCTSNRPVTSLGLALVSAPPLPWNSPSQRPALAVPGPTVPPVAPANDALPPLSPAASSVTRQPASVSSRLVPERCDLAANLSRIQRTEEVGRQRRIGRELARARTRDLAAGLSRARGRGAQSKDPPPGCRER